MLSFEGPGITLAWPGHLLSLTWRGLIVKWGKRYTAHLWLPKQ